ncbi:hypothetical protein GCM10011617_25270 [Novosphingobium arvoryzae]|uniref:Uncharacterized protein n=2 Tax=Novosphingobium arvoryzae TaxID=1256514 RepID=A0A918VJT0_9SPHN|nr:hypothetical protein GCM10011617_25270 [Novosphingobium arvoryzae]
MVHCNIIDEPHIGFTGFREFTVMSKQLTMSAAVSVLAMAVFALLGTDLISVGGNIALLPQVGYSAEAASLPDLGSLLPALQ